MSFGKHTQLCDYLYNNDLEPFHDPKWFLTLSLQLREIFLFKNFSFSLVFNTCDSTYSAIVGLDIVIWDHLGLLQDSF
jgi:hypothetical protein